MLEVVATNVLLCLVLVLARQGSALDGDPKIPIQAKRAYQLCHFFQGYNLLYWHSTGTPEEVARSKKSAQIEVKRLQPLADKLHLGINVGRIIGQPNVAETDGNGILLNALRKKGLQNYGGMGQFTMSMIFDGMAAKADGKTYQFMGPVYTVGGKAINLFLKLTHLEGRLSFPTALTSVDQVIAAAKKLDTAFGVDKYLAPAGRQ